MRRTPLTLAVTPVVGIELGMLAGQLLQAQPEGIKRTLLLRTDLGGFESQEAVMGLAEVASGAAAGRHYHHGDELGYVFESAAAFEKDSHRYNPMEVNAWRITSVNSLLSSVVASRD